MTDFEKAKIAAAATCHRLIAEERAGLPEIRKLGYHEERISNHLIRGLEKAADEIMELKEP